MVTKGSELIVVSETSSTNEWISQRFDSLQHGSAVMAYYQTAGKGQVANSWESERGKNVLLSVLLEPVKIPIDRQFLLSELIALSVLDVLHNQLKLAVCIKWPNDIYVGDKKIAGLLIENSVSATIMCKSVIGIGLNVNQTAFVSDAPNPVSMRQLTNREFNLPQLALSLCHRIKERYAQFDLSQAEGLHADYFRHLYRHVGFHLFQCGDEVFEAEIEAVCLTGHLCLHTKKGDHLVFAFKEVKFVI